MFMARILHKKELTSGGLVRALLPFPWLGHAQLVLAGNYEGISRQKKTKSVHYALLPHVV